MLIDAPTIASANQLKLSEDPKRNKIYLSFLQSLGYGEGTISDLAGLGYDLMRKEKCHPHFFGNNSLLETALYLTFFALELSYPPTNPEVCNQKITLKEAVNVIQLFERRIAEKTPVEYITNEAWYLENKFYVNENVLVPRSIMSTRFKDFLESMDWHNKRVLDLCTGSGCIGITLALMDPTITVDLVDISAKALEVAAANIARYDLQDRVKCIQSDLFSCITDKYDLIITNPPYVSTAEYNASPAEFKNEPKIALESGVEGLDIIHTILQEAKNYLNPQGKLIAEVGYPAAKKLKKYYRQLPFTWFKYRRPNGKESLLGMHGVFVCQASGLP